MRKFKCKLCRATFEVAEGKEPVCPICKATGDNRFFINVSRPL